MKATLTKRIVSLLAVVALLMTMFTGMVFTASADDTVTETYTMQDNSNLSYDKNGTNKEIFTVTNFGADTITSGSVAWTNHTYGGEVYSNAEEYPYGKIVVINRNRWKNNTSTSVGQLGLLTTNTVMDLSKGFTFKAVGQSIEVSDKEGVNQTGWDVKVGAYTISIRTHVNGVSGTVTFMKDGVALTDPVAIVPNADYNFNDVKFTNRTGVVNANVNVNVDTTTGEFTTGASVGNPFLQWNGLCEPSISYDAATKTLTLALDGVENIKSSRPETKKYVLNNVEPSEFKAVSASVTGGILNGLVALYEAELEVVKSAEQNEVTFTAADVTARQAKADVVDSTKDPSVKYYVFNNKNVADYQDLLTYSAEKLATVDVTKGFSFATPIFFNQVNGQNNGYKVDFGTFYVEVSYANKTAPVVNVCKADGTVIDSKTFTTKNHFFVSNMKNDGLDYANVPNNTTSNMTSGNYYFDLGITGDADGNITVFGGAPYSANYLYLKDYLTAPHVQGAFFHRSDKIATFNAATEGVAEYTAPVAKVKTAWSGAVLPTPEFTAVAAGSDDDTSSEDVSSDDTSSEDVSSDATSSDDTSSETVIETTTRFLPFEDIEAEKLKWTGRGLERIATEDVVINGKTYALRGSVVNQVSSNGLRPMTTNDTYDFGKKIKVNSTLVIYHFSDSYAASAYIRVGDFKFEIGDDLTNYYFRAYMGNEKVYEKLYESDGEHSLFHQVKLNAVIDTETKNVTLEHTYGAFSDAQDKYNHSANYTGDYSFDGVTCEAQAQNNFIRNETLDGEKTVNAAVVDFYVTKCETVTSDATSSEDVSSDATSSDDTISSGGTAVVEKTVELLPTTDVSKWTGRTQNIASNGIFAAVSANGEGNARTITSVDTFDFGDSLKVSGTLVQRQFSSSFGAKSYVKVGDFRFEIEDDKTTLYVRAYMGEEVVYEESWTRAELGNNLYSYFQLVDFNATIDNKAKTIKLNYTTGKVNNPTNNTASGTYKGDYSFDDINCEAFYQSNWIKPSSDGEVIAGVLNFAVTYSEIVEIEDISSEEVSSEAVSSEEVSSEAVSSEEVSSEDTSSETVVETTTNLLPTTSVSKWDGDTTYIAPSDIAFNNFVYVPAGGFAVRDNTNKIKTMTTSDTYELGNKFKLSGTLVAYALHTAEHYIQVYAQTGDFKFEIYEGLNDSSVRTLYARAYMGTELVYEKSWPQAGNTQLFRNVRFNATVDTTSKTVALDYTTGSVNSPETNTGSGTYKGDYLFDNATATVAAKNCWYNGTDYVNVGVGELSLTTYKVKEKKPVAFTVLADDETHGTVKCTPTGDVYVGDKVTITATAKEGYDFVGWVDQNNKPYYDLSATAEVTVGDINYYKAMFAVANIQSTVTISVKAKSNRVYSYTTNQNPTINGMMATDETIRKVVEDIPGYTLVGWINAETGVPVDASIVQTANILVAPVYTKKVETYAVSIDTVVNNYSFNTLVTAVSENDNFTSWTENDKVVSYAKEYSFFAGCDRTITSVNNGATTAKPVLSVNKAWSDGTYDYVLTEWALPEGYTLIAEGVIVTKDVSVDLVDITLADVDYNKIRVGTTELTTASGQYMIYTNTNVNFAYKAFLIYKDNTGKETTVYNMPVKEVSDYYSTDNWQPVDIVSAELMETTSEGCQWTTNIVMDGEIGFLCADTAGPYKTTDGGKTWKPSSLGWGASGSQSIAIDPKNPNHVIGAANCTANANYPDASKRNGIYLSYNGGETWKHAAYYCISSPRTYVNQFVFDPSSYNQSTGMCMTIYWSREDYSKNTLDNDPQLYKSTNGGENWSEVKVDADAEGKTGGARHLEIASDGTVFSAVYPSYIGTDTGYNMGTTVLYKLAKKYSWGSSYKWTKVMDNVRTFDIQNNVLYVSTTDGFYKASANKDVTSQSFGNPINQNTDYPEYTQMLAVSPSGQNMIMQLGDSATSHSDTYKNKYYSNDGGQTWEKVNVKDQVEQSKGTSFMPVPVRVSVSSFGVADGEEFIVSNFGDTIVRSSDCGATWVNSNKGYNVICTTEIAFNINNQNLMTVPSQDYNGAYSTDGGKTFTYLNWSGKSWGGFTYGGYIFDENNMCVINTDAWWDSATQKHVYTTHDGGVTFNRTSNYSLASDALQVSTGALNNDNIGFVGNLRTTDKGQTFTSMENIYTKSGAKVSGAHIRGVWDVQLDGKNAGRLYGCDSAGFAVYSDDNGETWIQFADLQATSSGRRILGMACDKKGFVYFYTCGTNGGYVEVQKATISSDLIDIVTPIDSAKKWNGSIEVDYYNGTIYIGAGSETVPKDSNLPCMWRSEDGGKTWIELSVHLDENLNKVGNPITENFPSGDVTRIVINYQTNEVFVVFVNHGIWKIGRTK